MQIEVNRKDFISALNVGGSMAGRVKTIPILEDVKITIKGTSAVISSFDNETAITKRTYIVSSTEDAMFCINHRNLVNILKTIKDENVSLYVVENVCTIVHSKGEATLPVEPAIDFPSPAKETDAQVVTLPCEGLFEWFKRARSFVASGEKAELRPVLGGVYFYVQNGEVGVASSDSFKFFHDRMQVDELSNIIVDALITPRSIDAILEVINGNETVDVSFGKKSIVFKVADAMVISRLIEGAYPKFKVVFDRPYPIEVKIGREELAESVSRATLSANIASMLLKLTIEPSGKIMIDSEDLFSQRKTHEEVACEVEGGSLEIGFKGSSLTDCLNTMDGETLIVSFNDHKSPAMFKESDGSAKAAVCLPMLMASNK
jgi:DNA polymerase-3 subunit beta